MEIKAYAVLVLPFVVLIYLAFLLFIRPPRPVIQATLLGGLTMGIINVLADLLAYYANWWHYDLSGLILHLPLPFYATPILIYGGVGYLLIWRFWRGRGRWFALLLLIGIPLFRAFTDFFGADVSHSSYAVWTSPLAALLNLLQWLIAFYAGYFVFRLLAPARVAPAMTTQRDERDKQEAKAFPES
ncbi:MAG: hypothetical protein M3Y81_28545 [Chloroflexota bacterium]|nr:hypothetical protein [Chloroflexota bacterium]